MATGTKIKTQCPACQAKYKVPAEGIGKRVQCPACRVEFRVQEYLSSPRRLPTEEDILSWLNEGMEEDDFDYNERYDVDDSNISGVVVDNSTHPLQGRSASPKLSDDRQRRLGDGHESRMSSDMPFRKTG